MERLIMEKNDGGWWVMVGCSIIRDFFQSQLIVCIKIYDYNITTHHPTIPTIIFNGFIQDKEFYSNLSTTPGGDIRDKLFL